MVDVEGTTRTVVGSRSARTSSRGAHRTCAGSQAGQRVSPTELASPHHRLDASLQLILLEGLAEVVVGAGAQARTRSMSSAEPSA